MQTGICIRPFKIHLMSGPRYVGGNIVFPECEKKCPNKHLFIAKFYWLPHSPLGKVTVVLKIMAILQFNTRVMICQDMEALSLLLALCEGNPLVTSGFPSQRANDLVLDVFVNSLGPSDAIWHWRQWSALVQVMACCLTAPSHYLNQCWLIISKAQWH